jgi:hypothetical protein
LLFYNNKTVLTSYNKVKKDEPENLRCLIGLVIEDTGPAGLIINNCGRIFTGHLRMAVVPIKE